ncbi:polyprotein [Arachis hypogaea]|nr:polyprotein [Arachis hypogaea]
MSLTIDPLQKISPRKEAWSIEAKILTIWEDASIVNENMQKLLHVVLMDKQHDKVQATVEDDLITTFIHQLKEGHVFIIFDFKVIPNGGLVRVTRHRFRILFKCSTSVVATASRVIPNPGLSLTSMDEILQKRTDYEKKIPCNLVGDCFAPIDINSLKKYQRPPVLILQSFKIKVNGVSLQNVINVSRVSINPDMQETVNFLNEYRIASHHFSRLRSNEIRDLVSVIDDEFFDWKLIRTIANLKGNNEDGQFFVVGKIKEIVEDPEWWVFSCVCGNPIVGNDNVFHCQLYGREVQHFMIRIKIVVEDGTSCGIFVLLDSAATKLLGRTCSDVFLLLEDEMEDVSSDSAFSPILEDFSQYGQLRSYDNQVISGVPIQLHSIKEMLADILCAKIYSFASRNDQICFLIGEIIDVLKHQKWWYYCCLCNAPVCHVGNVFYCYLCRVECVDAMRRYRIKIIVSHSNAAIFSYLRMMRYVNFARPVGYELNTSLHVVRAICDDINIVRFLEDSTHDNQQNFIWIPLFLIFLSNLRIQLSFSPMQAFNVRRAQVLQCVRLHRFLFSTGIVGLLPMIFMQEFRPHKVPIYLGIISLSLLGKSFGVPLDNVKILAMLLKEGNDIRFYGNMSKLFRSLSRRLSFSSPSSFSTSPIHSSSNPLTEKVARPDELSPKHNIFEEEVCFQDINQAIDNWEIPKIPQDELYVPGDNKRKSDYIIKTAENNIPLGPDSGEEFHLLTKPQDELYVPDDNKRKSDYIIKTAENNIPLGSDSGEEFHLLTKQSVREHAGHYRYLHIGDIRHNDFQDSLIGTVETSLGHGPVYFNCFPNKTVSLLDTNILDSLFLNIRIHGLNMKEGSIPAALIYRIQYKVMNTCNSRVLLKSQDRETTLFVTDMTKANVMIPRLIRWDEIDLPQSWSIDRAIPTQPRQAPLLREIKQDESGKVEIFFDRRNSFSSRSEAGTSNDFASARKSFSVTSQSQFSKFSKPVHSEINISGLQNNSNISQPVYQTDDKHSDDDIEIESSIQSPTYSSMHGAQYSSVNNAQ